MTGVLYIYFVGNLLLFPPVKEFLKSVKNGQSYRHKFGVLLFFGTPCSMVWLPDGEKNFDDMFCRFGRIPACDRRTDRHLSTA